MREVVYSLLILMGAILAGNAVASFNPTGGYAQWLRRNRKPLALTLLTIEGFVIFWLLIR